MIKMEVEVHSVETDGLPDMKNLVGRVAFIWDGAVVSGWPVSHEYSGIESDEQLWEPSEDRFGGPVVGVKYWIKFPVPAWKIDEKLGLSK